MRAALRIVVETCNLCILIYMTGKLSYNKHTLSTKQGFLYVVRFTPIDSAKPKTEGA